MRNVSSPSILRPLGPPRGRFERVSVLRQFVLVASTILVAGMVVVGGWLSLEIERSAVNRAAATAAIYVESILAAQLRPSIAGLTVSPETRQTLDRILNEGSIRSRVVRFKLWDADGAILYSSDPAQVGSRHPLDGLLAAAFTGTVQAHVSRLEGPRHVAERKQWDSLLEVYAPVHGGPRGEVVAVAEFYHSTDDLRQEIRSARLRSWSLVLVATLAMFLSLFLIMRRANDTIHDQRDDLTRQLRRLRGALEENERMHARLVEAGAATTALNEQFLHRIAADLHDAPAQTLALALMRFDELQANGAGIGPEMEAIRDALRASLNDLRGIASGLGIPGLARLTLAQAAHLAVRDFERRTRSTVEAKVSASLQDAPVATKITVYRLLQESLSNSARHAPGASPRVSVWQEGDRIRIEVSDRGQGFDPKAVAGSGRLGLAFMTERVRLLGGVLTVHSAPGQGTRIEAWLPLNAAIAATADPSSAPPNG